VGSSPARKGWTSFRRGRVRQMKTRVDAGIDDHIPRFPPEVRREIACLRAAIREEATGEREKIGYGIPTFDLNGNLVHFAAFSRGKAPPTIRTPAVGDEDAQVVAGEPRDGQERPARVTFFMPAHLLPGTSAPMIPRRDLRPDGRGTAARKARARRGALKENETSRDPWAMATVDP
jgi:hypothetical protein